MAKYNWTQVNNDLYGNPRYVIHFLEAMPESMGLDIPNAITRFNTQYKRTVKLMNKIGGRKYHNRSYGGGIVFSVYPPLEDIEMDIDRIKREYNMKHR